MKIRKDGAYRGTSKSPKGDTGIRMVNCPTCGTDLAVPGLNQGKLRPKYCSKRCYIDQRFGKNYKHYIEMRMARKTYKGDEKIYNSPFRAESDKDES
jgi:hypothetical protein